MGLQQAKRCRHEEAYDKENLQIQRSYPSCYTAVVPSGHYKKLMSTLWCMFIQGMTYKNYTYLICVGYLCYT